MLSKLFARIVYNITRGVYTSTKHLQYTNMTELQARSKYADLSDSFKLYYILGIGGFITILSYAIYQTFIVALTMAVSTIVVYIILGRKPERIIISTNAAGIAFDGNVFTWAQCKSWAAVELPDSTEFVLQTKTIQQRFIYFYAQPDEPGIKEFIQDISKNLTYDETMPYTNVVHNLLRRVGMM